MTKNFKGGYKIVSLNGNDLTSADPFTIDGLYASLENSYKKPILVTEIVIDGEKEQDAYAVVKKNESGYSIEVYGYALTVTDEDAVTSTQITLDAVTSIGGVSGDITLGEGLAITEEGELSASGGGGGKIYLHLFNLYETSPLQVTCRIALYTSRNEAFSTIDDFLTFMYESINSNTTFDVRGTYVSGSDYYPYQYIAFPPTKPTGSTTFKIWYLTPTGLSSIDVAPANLSIAGEKIIEV